MRYARVPHWIATTSRTQAAPHRGGGPGSTRNSRRLAVLALAVLLCIPGPASSADLVANGSFPADISGWNVSDNGNGTVLHDPAVGSGSLSAKSNTGANLIYIADVSQDIGPINSTDTVVLGFYWYKYVERADALHFDANIDLVKPDLSTVTIWTNTVVPALNTSIDGTESAIDISSYCDLNGTYTLHLISDAQGSGNTLFTQMNWDDVVVDVSGPPNDDSPVIASGATQAIFSPVISQGAHTTELSAEFSDADAPDLASFSCSFRLREPDDATVITLVDALSNGFGGLTVTSIGGASYRASYVYDPADAQLEGLYDLEFEVSDGTHTATDDFLANADELEVIAKSPLDIVTNGAFVADISGWQVSDNGNGSVEHDPSIGEGSLRARSIEGTNIFYVADVSQSVGPVASVESAVLSFSWRKSVERDDVFSFRSEVMIAKPDYTSHTVWLGFDKPTPGSPVEGTVTDLDLTSYFDQPGIYQIHLMSEGQGYGNTEYTQMTWDDVVLEVNLSTSNSAPTVTAGSTESHLSTVNRFGDSGTNLSTPFYDADNPGIMAFTVTYRIRDEFGVETTLVDDAQYGNGGLDISDHGDGYYRAFYGFDPAADQELGTYDIFFTVSDGTDAAVDDYANNLEEFEIVQETPPILNPGATTASVSPVARQGSATTTIATDFIDMDSSPASEFVATFKIRAPNDVDETVLVDSLHHGEGGLEIVDNGGGSYTARYDWDPPADQLPGYYDLHFDLADDIYSAADPFDANLNELEVDDDVPPAAPVVAASAVAVSPPSVDRLGADATLVSIDFYDDNQPPRDSFTITLRIREPDDTTELTLVDHASDGQAGLSVEDHGDGDYTARFNYDPIDTQATGLYDLYFEIDDGTGTGVVIDDYASNPDELEITDVSANTEPAIVAGALTVSPSSVDRLGAYPVTFTLPFSDADQPATDAFRITLEIRAQFDLGVTTLADQLQSGTGGLTVADDGGGSYTASLVWDPPDNATLGYYSLYAEVSDGMGSAADDYADNHHEFLLASGGENGAPIVPSDATCATPAGVERVGAHLTTIKAMFTDADAPPASRFRVSFMLRTPDDAGQVVLATLAAHGEDGVSIVDVGGGLYTASISWDPPDTQELGFYDLSFTVDDQEAAGHDRYENNLDELQVCDPWVNHAPTLTAGDVTATPAAVSRVGRGFTSLQASFQDADLAGCTSFRVSFRLMDPSATEWVLADLACDGEQGVRIRHLGGGDYIACVLWDPGPGQVPGTYDLYFRVEDASGSFVEDGYAANPDELTVSASAIPGDGNLLRRSHEADSCGGGSVGCHDIADHEGQDCLVCHTAHGSSNIYIVRESIQTPSSGDKSVLFKTLGIGDPYNDPDPVPGDPSSGALADAADGVFTGVCEVCHTTVTHHRNDGSTPLPDHYDAQNCTVCHPHSEGFQLSGGGESSGGIACSCHAAIMATMDESATGYRHILANDDADYSPGAENMTTLKNCLSCHVDHDIFRPDINTGVGERGRNLRVSWTVDPVPGDVSVLSSSDYLPSGNGGICLSCHGDTAGCGGCHTAHSPGKDEDELLAAESTYGHTILSKTHWDAATSAHNYNVPSVFNTDGSTFYANCSKCHVDGSTKVYQGPGFGVSVHGSAYENILGAAGIPTPTDPLEEGFCFKCHSTTSNPNAGSSMGYYGVKAITNPSALDIEGMFSRPYAHPTLDYQDRHERDDSPATLGSSNRHAECEDCHDVHAAQQGTHDGTSHLASNALKGTWGVEPTSWASSFTYLDNGNVLPSPASYSRVGPAVSEYQVCLKCHSNYVALPPDSPNLAAAINPNYASTHAIVQPGTNPYCNSTTMNEPWGTNRVNYCSDCHSSDTAGDPAGPHGSNLDHLLVASIVSDATNGTPLCFVCHKSTVYWTGGETGSRFGRHPPTQGQHKRPQGCFACHMWDYSFRDGLGLNSIVWLGGTSPTGPIRIHGQNRAWIYNERFGTAGSGQPADSFINGYMADLDYTAKRCWSETCKSHENAAY